VSETKAEHSADAADFERAAYHAAGHAIACDELGVYYEKVSVADTCRRVSADDSEDLTPEQQRHYTLIEAVIDFAGHAAVVKVLQQGDMSGWPARELGAGPDFDKARARLHGDGARMVQAKVLAVDIVEARSAQWRKLAQALVVSGELTIGEVDLLLARSKPGL
jgi:hypothetical protein